MELTQWYEQYKPHTTNQDQADHLGFVDAEEQPSVIHNPRDPETIQKLEEYAEKNPDGVWTILDADCSGHFYVVSGYHYVNRVGYLFSDVPCAEENIEIDTWDEDDYEWERECEERDELEEELEDSGPGMG